MAVADTSKSRTVVEVDETTPLLNGELPDPAAPGALRSSDPSIQQDGDTDGQTKDSPSHTSVWTVIPILMIGVFIAQADSSIVLATSQQIASEFHVLSDAAWLVTSYVLAQSASQPLYGKLSDIFGRKANLVVAYSLFTVGCLLCGTGKTYWQVLLGRAVSGVGGAGMLALISIVLADMLPVREVAAWRSYVNVVATLGRSSGGPAGGWLTDSVGWRWCFLAQCPIAALAALLVIWRLPNMAHAGSRTDEHAKQDMKTRISRVDWLGVTTLPCMLVACFMALEFVGKFRPWYYIVPSSLLAFILAVVFFYVEKYQVKEPVLAMELISHRDVYTPYLIILFQTGSQFIITYSIPIYFQIATGMSVSSAGTRIVLIVIGNTIGGLVSGTLIHRTKRYKALMIGAVCLCCTNYILVLTRWHGAASWAETSYIILGGLGMGTIQSTTFVHLAASVDAKDMAVAGTSWFLSQSLGVLVAANLFNLIHSIALEKTLNERLVDVPERIEIIKQAISSVEYIWTLPTSLRSAVAESYIRSLLYTDGLALVFGVFAAIMVFTIRERVLKDK